uniref:Alpha-2-macroglobulin-like n=1 Tax=Gouania willdenowi TaxID=441366 RepID=A0A8C5GA48_GOUWI
MGHPGRHLWTWTVCVLLCGICSSDTHRGKYMVAIPAVLEAGAETKFCASLLNPNETLVMTITLMSTEANRTLLTRTSSEVFHICSQFQVPSKNDDVQNLKVEVRGNTFYSQEIRKVLIKTYQPMTFAQTDKPIYLPGQTVHFRVVTLDTKLRHVSQQVKNRIGQWLNVGSDSKILQLSYSLNSEAMEGLYQITIAIGENKVFHNFKVEKYVLPKFDVTLHAKEEISVIDTEFEAEMCAKYTYGQSVPGVVTLNVCRPLNRYISGNYGSSEITDIAQLSSPCHTETKKTDKNGCAKFTIKMSTFNQIHKKALQDVLNVNGQIEEEGTGVSRSSSLRIRISYVVGKLSFIDVPKFYTKEVKVEGKVKAVFYNNTPIPDMPLYLFEGQRWSPSLLQNLTSDNDGVAKFSLSTENLNGDVHLQISDTPTTDYAGYRMPFYEKESHTLTMFQPSSLHTKTVSSLEVQKIGKALTCHTEEEISIHYTVVGESQGTMEIMYLVLSRGAIVMQGFGHDEVQEKTGKVSFKLNVSPDMAPEVQVVAYAVLPSENVIAHSADFETEKCFSNKVSLEFSPSSAVPGEKTNMHLMAQADSLCGISAVDQSVLIKEPGKTLEADKIFDLLPVRKSSYIPYQAEDPTECLHVRPKRYVMPYPEPQDDAFSIFQNVGLKMATNLFIRVPSCLKYKGREYRQGHGGYGKMDSRVVAMATPGASFGAGAADDDGVPPVIETVRTFFPETWIWDLVEVGESGERDVPLIVPDTITTWETETFCLSSQGFGLAPRQKVNVFQPFFLELTLPYSIIRGEQFELKATTFNYLTSCIMMTVTPAPATDYTLTPLSGDKYTSCLCGNDRRTVSWMMIPSTLGVVNVSVSAEAVASHASCDNEIVSVPERGRVDVVTKSLIVKAEGITVAKVQNWLLCPKGDALKEEIEIQLPDNVIEGSTHASVSVLGDILGRAMNNLNGLLQMPYGCGEQNMALLAPNIYILQYLEGTQQLTPNIREKATNFLTSGYQRQLNYKHGDGAYSTFGSGAGNTWLTAFVLRSFAKAQSFIYIDPANIEESQRWLEQKQRENGCFEQLGKLFNNRMKGGVSNEVTLSAYITAAFLEMNRTTEVVKRSLSCLKESLSDLSNTYTTALLAYVFTLAGDMETRDQLLQYLDNVAIKQRGFTYWSQKATERSASLSVEISSYVLMAKLSATPTAEDLGYSAGIVRWLTDQQNSYGGFSSTQDTVVALQALALYSTLVFNPGGSSAVMVQSPSEQLLFDINQDNKLLYQEKMLQGMVGKYTAEVKGSACASVQLSLLYNIPTPTKTTTLSVEVKTEVDASKPQRTKVTLQLKSLYSGMENTTNMVILDIKVLSGFVPSPESMKRVEDFKITSLLFLIQEVPVQNMKPAVVKIYDYYQPDDQAETEYIYT